MARAQLSLDRLSSPHIEVIDHLGELYSDGWISRAFGFRIRALADLDAIVLRLWNPDFAMRYLHNRLTMTVDGVARTSPPLFPAQLVTIEHKEGLRAGDSCDIGIASERYCKPDRLDDRERGVVFVDAVFALANIG